VLLGIFVEVKYMSCDLLKFDIYIYICLFFNFANLILQPRGILMGYHDGIMMDRYRFHL
jgi:hypothetical protein